MLVLLHSEFLLGEEELLLLSLLILRLESLQLLLLCRLLLQEQLLLGLGVIRCAVWLLILLLGDGGHLLEVLLLFLGHLLLLLGSQVAGLCCGLLLLEQLGSLHFLLLLELLLCFLSCSRLFCCFISVRTLLGAS